MVESNLHRCEVLGFINEQMNKSKVLLAKACNCICSLAVSAYVHILILLWIYYRVF